MRRPRDLPAERWRIQETLRCCWNWTLSPANPSTKSHFALLWLIPTTYSIQGSHDRSAPRFHSGFRVHTMVVSKRTRALVLLTVQNASISLLTRHSRRGHHQDLYLPSVAVLSAEVSLSCTPCCHFMHVVDAPITFFYQPCILGYAAFWKIGC